MKNILKTTLLCIVVSTLSASAQGHIAKSRLKKIADQFNELEETDRVKYVQHKNKAFKARENQKYFTCLTEISNAQSIFQNDMDLLFLNGICHAQIHDIDKAVKCYEKVLEIDHTHIFTLMNIIEINYFAGRFEETIKYIKQVNSIVDSRANGRHLPLLDFKYLISLTKLSKQDPEKYKSELAQVKKKYTFMDDHPFYYFANALESLDKDDKQEGLIWILKGYLIFENPATIEVWNKALVDTDYIGAHEIMFNRQEQ